MAEGLTTTEEAVELEAVGLEVRQSSLVMDLYVFTIDGKTIAKQLGVRRMKWHRPQFKADGFQRTLDLNRVREIATYLSKNPVLPNTLVVAFEKGTLEFKPLPGQGVGHTKYGIVSIHGKLARKNGELVPLPENDRIGYVIDGQHRLRSIEESTLAEGTFPVIVSAFHGVDAKFQLNQFYALNQTVQIAQSHLALLRRELGLLLSPREANKKVISDVCGLIQNMPNSPFQPEKHIGTAIYKGPLQITVLESMVHRAIKNTSLRFKWKQNANDIPQSDIQEIATSLYVFWRGISEVYGQYWGKRPTAQRLFCALGLYTMVLFHDKVMENIDIHSANAGAQVKAKLDPIKDIPWDKMLPIPATVKTYFRPENLFDALNDLWQQNGARPFKWVIREPQTQTTLVEVELP